MFLQYCSDLLLFIFSVSILITVHELGHYLLACFFQVKVERFSIGFGPILYRWVGVNGTEYVISAILLGGYVTLFNRNIQENMEHNQKCNAFNYKKFWQKSIIVLSGPIANFLFAMLSYVLVFIIGIPTYKPIINAILPNSIIDQTNGISSGLEIKTINNIPTNDWKSVRSILYKNIGKDKLVITTTSFERSDVTTTHIVSLPNNWLSSFSCMKDPILELGIIPCNMRSTLILSEVEANSVAKKAGLQIGDKILSINQKPICSWESFVDVIQHNADKIVQVEVKRKKKILNLDLIFDRDDRIYANAKNSIIFGMFPKIIMINDTKNCIVHRCGLYSAVIQAFDKTCHLIYLIGNTLFQLFSGKIEIIHLRGPIAIAQGAGEAVRFGIVYYLMFLALISINLGIVNLLPFPVLDGGQLLFLLVEKIKGGVISQEIQNFGYIISYVMLTVLMCLVFINDISMIFRAL